MLSSGLVYPGQNTAYELWLQELARGDESPCEWATRSTTRRFTDVTGCAGPQLYTQRGWMFVAVEKKRAEGIVLVELFFTCSEYDRKKLQTPRRRLFL